MVCFHHYSFNASPLEWEHVVCNFLVCFGNLLFILRACCNLVPIGVMQEVFVTIGQVSCSITSIFSDHCSHDKNVFVWNESYCIPITFSDHPTVALSEILEPLEYKLG